MEDWDTVYYEVEEIKDSDNGVYLTEKCFNIKVTNLDEPNNIKQALNGPDAGSWRMAIERIYIVNLIKKIIET